MYDRDTLYLQEMCESQSEISNVGALRSFWSLFIDTLTTLP